MPVTITLCNTEGPQIMHRVNWSGLFLLQCPAGWCYMILSLIYHQLRTTYGTSKYLQLGLFRDKTNDISKYSTGLTFGLYCICRQLWWNRDFRLCHIKCTSFHRSRVPYDDLVIRWQWKIFRFARRIHLKTNRPLCT